MGDLILLSEYRAGAAARASGPRRSFHFDLGCPYSYFAAERVERALGDVDWVPAPEWGASGPHVMLDMGRRHEVERRAAALRLPLSWPDLAPTDCTAAHRVAAQAAEFGVGGAFALAAARLTFCGGFDLTRLDTLIDASAAAGLPLELCRDAAEDPRWDALLRHNSSTLTHAGVRERPAVCVEGKWSAGMNALAEAAARLQARQLVQGPLAPAG